MKYPLILLQLCACVLQAAPPSESATEARLWLKIPQNEPLIGPVTASAGSASEATWEKDEAARQRTRDVVFPIRWWSWSAQEIRFTPSQDGTVELWLLGPWSPADKDGSMPRKEVLWDNVAVEGATISNGDFEAPGQGAPAGWTVPWSAYPGADEWPLQGAGAPGDSRVAAAWCERPLMQALKVSAGRPVTIRLHAKAATPPDFTPPKRLGRDTPAHRALAELRRGVNLGNCWEFEPGVSWGVKFAPEDIDRIADEGFDHIRVPVAWHFRLREKNGGYEIDPAFLGELEPVLRRALERKMRVLLNWHHFNDLTADPQAHRSRFTGGWDAIARHFRDWQPGLFFELLNEPCDALTTTAANPIYQEAIRVIRKSNPGRILLASPGNWGVIGELGNLRLPDDEDRIIVTVHCYEPFFFTHQKAGWAGLKDLDGVRYPGPPESPLTLPDSLRERPDLLAFMEGYHSLPPERNPSSPRNIRTLLDQAREWSDHFGRPVHLGEFGAHDPADMASRKRYLRDVRLLAEQRGIPWTLWEWKAGFGYWDPQTNRPRFRDCLME